MRRRSAGSSKVVAAATSGFLAGAITAGVVFWGFPNLVMHAPNPRDPRPADQPLVTERTRVAPATTDGRPGVIEGRPHPLVDPAPAVPAVPSPTTLPIVAADVSPEIRELRDRKLELPVRGVTPANLHDSFHDPRGTTHGHEAIDILAPRNTPILAVEDGTIARLFESKAGGTTVYQFDPTTRYVYYYAHLERYADGLGEGNHVQRGQVLGYVGTSGNAPKNTPHLHFAIFRMTDKKQWWQGRPIDPYDILK